MRKKKSYQGRKRRQKEEEDTIQQRRLIKGFFFNKIKIDKPADVGASEEDEKEKKVEHSETVAE